MVSLVLEGGGMRGLYTCGVLDYFMDNGIKFPKIYGVSAGAGHAMSYVSWQRGRAGRVGIEYVDDWRYCSKRSMLVTGGMFGVKFIYETIPAKLDFFDYDTFNNNDMKLIAVCSNVETGKAMYIPVDDSRRDMKYVYASGSLPLVSKIVKTPYGKLLDGGICDSIPVRHALTESDFCVAVLTQPAGFVKKPTEAMSLIKLRYGKYKKFVEANANRHKDYNESLAIVEKEERAGRVLSIRPSCPIDVSRIEKDKTKLWNLYGLGYNDAKNSGVIEFLERCK